MGKVLLDHVYSKEEEHTQNREMEIHQCRPPEEISQVYFLEAPLFNVPWLQLYSDLLWTRTWGQVEQLELVGCGEEPENGTRDTSLVCNFRNTVCLFVCLCTCRGVDIQRQLVGTWRRELSPPPGESWGLNLSHQAWRINAFTCWTILPGFSRHFLRATVSSSFIFVLVCVDRIISKTYIQ